jgi:hypothetical protein
MGAGRSEVLVDKSPPPPAPTAPTLFLGVLGHILTCPQSQSHNRSCRGTARWAPVPQRQTATGNMSLVTQVLSTWYRQWSRNSSRISNSAKHDELAAHSDTRTIRGQIDHNCIGRRLLRRWSDDWIVPSTLILPSFRSPYPGNVNRIMAIDFEGSKQ